MDTDYPRGSQADSHIYVYKEEGINLSNFASLIYYHISFGSA